MEWSNDKTIHLIKLFHEKYVLWDTTDLYFKDRNKKHDAWAELGGDMGMGVGDTEKKVRSLVGQLPRELKKGKSGSEADAQYKSKWMYFKSLLFLRDKNEPCHKREACFHEVASKGDTFQSEDNDTPVNATQSQSFDESDVDMGNQVRVPQQTSMGATIPRKSELPALKRKADVLAEEAYMVMKELSSKVRKRDEFDVFGEHVAHSLRNLTRRSSKNYAKFQINNILYQAEVDDLLPSSIRCVCTSPAVSTPSPRDTTPVPSSPTGGDEINCSTTV